MNKNFIDKSKTMHQFYKKQFWAGAFDPNHSDTARHYHMLDNALSFLKCLKPESILTIGDNLARDAGYIKKHIECYTVASDLNTGGLEEAKTKGFVDDILDVDVEHIPFKENEFDVVFAKESYHHWPRPNLGIYEMLRVAKKAIVLIEPYDVFYANPKPYIKDTDFRDDYEKCGNYKYQISLREMLKTAWALEFPLVAAKGFNDPYDPKISIEDWLIKKQKLDDRGQSGERQYNLMAICLFKTIENINLDLLKNCTLYHKPHNRFNNI